MEKKWYRMYVVANFPNYKHKFSFAGMDKKQVFISCINFANGFIHGFCVNNNMPISTNSVPSIDGHYWWATLTNDKVLFIEDEEGKMIAIESDL